MREGTFVDAGTPVPVDEVDDVQGNILTRDLKPPLQTPPFWNKNRRPTYARNFINYLFDDVCVVSIPRARILGTQITQQNC